MSMFEWVSSACFRVLPKLQCVPRHAPSGSLCSKNSMLIYLHVHDVRERKKKRELSCLERSRVLEFSLVLVED